MIGIVTGLTAEARIGMKLGRAVAGGGTTLGATQAATELIAQGATALISFGLAGGLNPGLPPGTLIIPPEIVTEEAVYTTDPELTRLLGGPAYTLSAVPEIVVAAEEKHRLFYATRTDAVDMESGAMAEVAALHSIPFAALRAICDPATTTLPPAALIALNAAGAIDPRQMARSILHDPVQIIALIKLARHAAQARAALIRHVGLVGNLEA